MYKMMSFFLNDVLKHIDKAGNLPVRANDKRGDVFIGYFQQTDKLALCYRGEMFFVLPDEFQIFNPPQCGLTDFGMLGGKLQHQCRFSVNKRLLHPNGKTVLQEIVSIHDEAPNIFSRGPINERVYYDKAYIQEKYAKWLEELSDYYGGQTELWTDGLGMFTLLRTNGDVIAVVLEVRI